MPVIVSETERLGSSAAIIVAVFLLAMGVLPLPLGSGSTIVFFLMGIAAVVQVLRGATSFHIMPAARFAVGASLVYFAMDAMSLLLYPGQPRPWAPMVITMQFVVFPLLLLFTAQPKMIEPLRLFVWGVRIGAILGFLFAVTEMLDGGQQATGGMPNSIEFGVVSGLFAFLSLLGTADENWRCRAVAGFACSAGLAASLMSGTRGAWLAFPVFGVIVLLYFRARLGTRSAFIGGSILATIGLVVALATIVASPGTRARLESLRVRDYSREEHVLQWTYGVEAFLQRPLLGYGPEAAVTVASRLAAEDGQNIDAGGWSYNHLHNDFVSEAVGNGVVGLATLLLILAAPLVTALKGPKDRLRSDRLAFASLIVASSAVSGMTSTGFQNDILNTVFVSALLVVCLSASRPGR